MWDLWVIDLKSNMDRFIETGMTEDELIGLKIWIDL